MNEKNHNFKSLEEEIKNKEKIISLKYVSEEEARVIEEELENEDEIESDSESSLDPYRFAGYDPDVLDFIRRCDTDEQAFEIITYLEAKGEITTDESEHIMKQLKTKGLRSFGPKREHGFYFNPDE